VIIGGAPVTDAYATRIGADGYAADAAGAVELARALLQK
jgi:5-methyltetrahydrofolate--homocysteine methyltransferase